jgi:hypothetical protein
MHPFNKLIAKKKAEGMKPMSPVEKQAKMGVIQDMRKMASDSMASPLHDLKKVSVASNSPQGLAMGLDKAKQIVSHNPEDDEQGLAHGGEVENHAPGMDENDPDHDSGDLHHASMEGLEEETGDDLDHDNESGEDVDHIAKMDESHAEAHASDLEQLSPEDIDKRMQELHMMKAAYHKKHGGGFPR